MNKVSIICPVYNGEKFLPRFIQTCLNQDHRDIELIIVNDGSFDGSETVIQKFAETDPRIKMVKLQENLGLPAAINHGVRASSGSLITWIACDDYVAHDYVSCMAEFFIDPEIEFVYSDYYFVNEQEEILSLAPTETPDKLVCGNVLGQSNLYRRSLLEKIGLFDEDRFMYEDYDFYVRVWKSGSNIIKVPVQNYFYTWHDKQLTKTTALPLSYFHYRFELIEEYLPEDSLLRGRAIVSFLHKCLQDKRFRVALSCMVRFVLPNAWSCLKYVLWKLANRSTQRTAWLGIQKR